MEIGRRPRLKTLGSKTAGSEYGNEILLNTTNLFIALKFIIISQENESKADSIVDKQRDLLKTCLVQSRIYEKITFHVTVVCCLLGLIFNGNRT